MRILARRQTARKDDFIVHPNLKFQQWVTETFKTTIPQNALELVTPAHLDDEKPSDDFLIWVNRVAE